MSAVPPRQARLFAYLHACFASLIFHIRLRQARSRHLQLDEINDDTNERHRHVIDFPFPAIEADAHICVSFGQLGAADERLGG
ncbi:hypothetical protein [Rhizobium vallis]|uniref:hypothetical protein n=1 Tax=Rhizobium vallis TaxID=634290 RepID=UPI0013DF0152|nr:hypothetical protein [Rhizobium vallis]